MADVEKPTAMRRVMRATLNTSVTLAVLAASGGAVVYGSSFLAERAEASAIVETADLIPVAVTPLLAEPGYSVSRHFVGQVEAAANVDVSFELGGRLAALLVDEGDLVNEGQLLAQLDTALLEAEQTRLEAARAATEAQLEFAEGRLLRAAALREEGFASEETLDQARATRDELTNRIAETDAAIAAVRINIEKSDLRAPFEGRVGQRVVDGGETLGAGGPVLTLIETAAPQVRVGLPLSVATETLSDVTILINGAEHAARLAQLRPDIDPVTRTRTAVFDVQGDIALAFGQTATLALETQVDLPGAWVALDALQEGLGSAWTILVVEDGTVRTAAVEVLHSDAENAFVRGTFEPGAQMIRTGAHRVVPGQQVTVIAEAE